MIVSCVDAAWADISGSVEERKQHLEESNKNLDIFQMTEVQLGQWLSEKELMMSVLGPLSIDPNMLKMQKQQVQVGMACVGWSSLMLGNVLGPDMSSFIVPSRSCRMNLRAVNFNMSNSRKLPLPSSAQATRILQVVSWCRSSSMPSPRSGKASRDSWISGMA